MQPIGARAHVLTLRARWFSPLASGACAAAFFGTGVPFAYAAGGHHAVDDASLLDAGQCQIETWIDRRARPRAQAANANVGCRVGPAELELAMERISPATRQSIERVVGLKVKWAYELAPGWSTGVIVAPSWDVGPDRRYGGTLLLVPVTWRVSDRLQAHVNVGREFTPGALNLPRVGLALEWSMSQAWSVIGELFRESSEEYARLGTRWHPTSAWSFDLSRTRAFSAAQPRWWTLGANIAF